MVTHRFELEKYKGMNTRHRCPSCQQRDKTFSRYIDTETGQHIAINVGRCNRENGCGYHYTPAEYFKDNNLSFDGNEAASTATLHRAKVQQLPGRRPQHKAAPVAPSYIAPELLKRTLQAYDRNSFVTFLINRFGLNTASGLIEKYYIGTSGKIFQQPADHPGYISPKGSVIFWQIDIAGKIRAGKIMLYDAATGKRVKKPFEHVSWTHITLQLQNFQLKQCFYGEHLLRDGSKPVAIVESEKTAIIASMYFPQFIWIACGNMHGLNEAKCEVLKGRQVILYPDLKAYEKWVNKAEELRHITSMQVSNYLERYASEAERATGLDIADFLLRYEPKDFAVTKPVTLEKKPLSYEVTDGTTFHIGNRVFLPDFAGIELSTFYLSDGRTLDVLLDSNEDFVIDGATAAAIGKEYKKTFQPGTLYGHACLMHSFN